VLKLLTQKIIQQFKPMETKNNYAFKYAPKIFYHGTQKYIFYQFSDATLTLPLRNSNTIKTNGNKRFTAF
jgi:hypothetical protein